MIPVESYLVRGAGRRDTGAEGGRPRGYVRSILLPTMEIGAMRFAVLANQHGATFDVIEFIG